MTTTPAGQRTLRRHNIALVLDTVATGPGVSRADIAARTGLTKATVSTLVDQLLAADLVADTGLQQARGGRGRRGTGLALSQAGPHGLGVEIGVDYLATGLVDLAGVLHAHRVRSGDNRRQSVPKVLARAARAVRTGLRDAAARGVAVARIGVAVPGLVETSGLLRSAPNLGWHDIDVRVELARRLEPPCPAVDVGNEADFAASAELVGSQWRDFVHVSGEVGIGAGIVVDGRLLRGVRGFSGEVGHVCVDPSGPPCGCGARGCLEAVAGQDALLRHAGIPAGSRPPATLVADLVELLRARDPRARRAVRHAGRSLGIALAAVVNVVDVPAVVLGGSYAPLAPWLVDPVQAELDTRTLSAAWSPVTVRASRLGTEAAVHGAGACAVRSLIDDPEPYLPATSG